jgi:hypothetical protein
MIGAPKRLKTSHDFETSHQLAIDGEIPAGPVRAAWQGLLNTCQVYVFNQILAAESDRTGPEPEYCVLTGQGEAEDEVHEFKLVDNPNAPIDALGYSSADVEAKITELEGL